MHIPDGFLDAKTALSAGAIALGGLGFALHRAGRTLPPRRIPLMGLSASFIFAAQMLNFPVGVGTSGHLMGGVLAAVLLGPSPAVVVMAAVLIVQCLMFSDGGITALGANVFNMAIVGAVGGYAVYRAVCRFIPGLRGQLVGAAFGAWCSTVLASVCCAGELAMSGTAKASIVLPAMVHIHMVIGVGEALITALVLAAIARTRPELLSGFEAPIAAAPENEQANPIAGRPAFGMSFLIYGLLISLGLAIFVSPLASSAPDGLEKVAELIGFEHAAAENPVLASPIPDYEMPGFSSAALATAVAGAAGTVVVFFLALLLARILTPKASSV